MDISLIGENEQNPNSMSSDFVLYMDLRGIEPLSENLFRAVSPITVFILTFPPCIV